MKTTIEEYRQDDAQMFIYNTVFLDGTELYHGYILYNQYPRFCGFKKDKQDVIDKLSADLITAKNRGLNIEEEYKNEKLIIIANGAQHPFKYSYFAYCKNDNALAIESETPNEAIKELKKLLDERDVNADSLL